MRDRERDGLIPGPRLQKKAASNRSLVLLVLAAFTFDVAAQDTSSSVLAPIDAMFQGMAHRDAAAIKATAIPGAVMVLMRNGKPEQMTVEAFADRIGQPSKTKIEERIHAPLVRVDDDLAMVWAPFDLLVDGKLNHCGTDLFNLVRAHGKWRIAAVADTGNTDCAQPEE